MTFGAPDDRGVRCRSARLVGIPRSGVAGLAFCITLLWLGMRR